MRSLLCLTLFKDVIYTMFSVLSISFILIQLLPTSLIILLTFPSYSLNSNHVECPVETHLAFSCVPRNYLFLCVKLHFSLLFSKILLSFKSVFNNLFLLVKTGLFHLLSGEVPIQCNHSSLYAVIGTITL